MRIQTKCYFDASKICLGKTSNSFAVRDYSGDYYASEFFFIQEEYNPTGKTEKEIKQDNSFAPISYPREK